MHCTFKDNAAARVVRAAGSTSWGGGAISTQFGTLLLESCLFEGNAADDEGGALDAWARPRTPFLVLGSWDKNTGICAGAMPYRRDFAATTRI